MIHEKRFRYQIRCTDIRTGEKEQYDIDWGIKISHLDGCNLIHFTKANGNDGAFMIRSESLIEVGFFEDE